MTLRLPTIALPAAVLLPLLLAACSGLSGPGREAGPEVAEEVGADEGPRELAYACPDGLVFLATVAAERVRLELPEGPVELPAVPAASGARYADAHYDFWSRGEEALLDRPGFEHRGCRSDPERLPWERARLRGATLRAIGQEPGWWLEIRRDGTLELASDYGTRRQVVEAPEPEPLGAGSLRYDLPEVGMTVTMAEEACRDVMSGRDYPLRVTVETPRERLQGCGRRLG